MLQITEKTAYFRFMLSDKLSYFTLGTILAFGITEMILEKYFKNHKSKTPWIVSRVILYISVITVALILFKREY
ncbi:hypothetical protein [Tenacibaculum jejuense]|uniref:hypothetical protein n=1 Tax=Tenacibaculum jejuense TaxID=584609 RepID=UPI000BA4A14D|nr:hypothetical protein [Tenacibaculum jejuense]